MKSVQVPSGVGVLPSRTLSARPVPDGDPAAHAASTQVTDAPASRTTCWTPSPVNVAANSRERPGAYRPAVLANAPSTVSRPPETVDAPPAFQGVLVQSAGRAVPVNSEPAVGLRMTSPSPAWTR